MTELFTDNIKRDLIIRELFALKSVIMYFLYHPEAINSKEILGIKGLFKNVEDAIEEIK